MLSFKWEMQSEDLCANENESVGKEFDDAEERLGETAEAKL